MLKSNICVYNDAYIVRGDINVTAASVTQLALKIKHHLLNPLQKLMVEIYI